MMTTKQLNFIAFAIGCLMLAGLVSGLRFLSVDLDAQESTSQMQLVGSPAFLQRVEYLALQEARTVKAEALNGSGATPPYTTACHVKRSLYADTLFRADSGATIPRLAAVVVGGVNLIGTVTGTAPTATSSATDAAILSQIHTFWNQVSGCDTGS